MSKFIWMVLISSLALLSTPFASATPKEVIIIRHTDKSLQDESGPALAATGLARSVAFAFYFLHHFGEPDYIIAADDEQKTTGKEIAIRSIQTVAPLANIMQERYPDQEYPILHLFPSDSYQELANYILKEPMFNNKRVLICWSHKRIGKLTAAFGVTDNIPDWPKPEYDTVYYLQFQAGLKKVAFSILRNQFPVNTHMTWEDLNRNINGPSANTTQATVKVSK